MSSTPDDFKWDDTKVKEFILGLSNTNIPLIKELLLRLEEFKASTHTARDWEVVEFLMIQSYNIPGSVRPHIFTLEEDGKYHSVWDIIKTMDDLMRHPDTKINSVKRLSDGELFTIGDEIDFKSHKNYVSDAKITSFNIEKDDISVCGNDWSISLQKTTAKAPKREVLFVDETGKEFNVGDEVWMVFTDEGYGFGTWKTISWKFNIAARKFNEWEKVFVSKEDALLYIENNQRLLSYNDVVALLTNFENLSAEVLWPNYEIKLKQLIKERIKH